MRVEFKFRLRKRGFVPDGLLLRRASKMYATISVCPDIAGTQLIVGCGVNPFGTSKAKRVANKVPRTAFS